MHETHCAVWTVCTSTMPMLQHGWPGGSLPYSGPPFVHIPSHVCVVLAREECPTYDAIFVDVYGVPRPAIIQHHTVYILLLYSSI